MNAEVPKGDEEVKNEVQDLDQEGTYDLQKIKVDEIIDEVKAGDSALNKLKVQNLDFILDIPLKVTVELGRTKVLVKDLLQMGQGSVIELDKLAGEPLEILVNGKLVARGEVVVINEKFGARLTDIISPIERIETLK
ncbi:MAG: flagellar motor switch protein FliN [Halobacteriovoraceae bacterium]|nr:flagellar motor switch protein FliN [Halobacteriovoraceae bacterium]